MNAPLSVRMANICGISWSHELSEILIPTQVKKNVFAYQRMKKHGMVPMSPELTEIWVMTLPGKMFRVVVHSP